MGNLSDHATGAAAFDSLKWMIISGLIACMRVQYAPVWRLTGPIGATRAALSCKELEGPTNPLFRS